MWIINFSKANCKNCYACVRACPVEAIKVQSEQAKIVKERCIGCGKCLRVCPKNAKQVQSELERVKEYLYQNETVVASVAPSFAALFNKQSKKIPSLLRKLGFNYVEETVVGADVVTQTYEAYSRMPGEQCYITSCCPTVNALIQKHYPELVAYLIPVVSPASCHARLLKKKYGPGTRVVFIGPCLSKKIEGSEEAAIDAVLTFEELEQWLAEENLHIENLEESAFDSTNRRQRAYPVVGGMTHTISCDIPRKIIQVDGIEECKDLLEHVKKGAFKNTLLEVHGCRQSCLGGAGMPADGVSIYERRERVKAYAQSEILLEVDHQEETSQFLEEVNLHKDFPPLKKMLKEPTKEEITHILRSIGKENIEDELNCGSCGYHTCLEKAIAVYNSMAEPNMCLPYMRQKAEKLTNVIFEATPNMIIMVDEEFMIKEINPAAKKFFNIDYEHVENLPVALFLEEGYFKGVKSTKKNMLSQKVILKDYTGVVIQSIIWSEYHHVMLWIANDITKDEDISKKLQSMKRDAIDMAQQVINKQMIVAQEIASLLGETTAETKVTLTKLKNLIQEEEGLNQ